MTCCIACLADSGKSAVLASDNMLCHTIDKNTLYLAEATSELKIIELSSTNYILISGDGGMADSIISMAEIKSDESPSEIAKKISEKLVQYVKERKEIILRQYDLTWNTFLPMMQHMEANFLSELTQKLNLYNANCDFIAVGRDNSSENVSLYQVDANGVTTDRTKIGSAIIGIGMSLANLSLVKSRYDKSMPLSEIEKIVEAAIECASHSYGVGRKGSIFKIPSTE